MTAAVMVYSITSSPTQTGRKRSRSPLSTRSGRTLTDGLGGQSLKCLRFKFCCTAADITAALAASMHRAQMPMMTPAKDLVPVPLQSGARGSTNRRTMIRRILQCGSTRLAEQPTDRCVFAWKMAVQQI